MEMVNTVPNPVIGDPIELDAPWAKCGKQQRKHGRRHDPVKQAGAPGVPGIRRELVLQRRKKRQLQTLSP